MNLTSITKIAELLSYMEFQVRREISEMIS